ncbi:MAG: nitrogenase iron-molybdenum cofactor biosynthesis protein NifN [Nitrospirae bacterium]|nr:nitrogenase iron-molybdenum cofactor biosynthesis protein NifN [Nitrospirota bacterium]
MAIVNTSNKACTVNPLKLSQPIGAALTFLGINRSIPVLHGSQGCTSFGLVLFVRHFREMIPMQTTAMNEATTILGGTENIEEALLTLYKKASPEIISLCTTGLTETKGEDIAGAVKEIRGRHPELNQVAIVPVSTPDFVGAFQDGWSKAVARIVEDLAEGEPEVFSGRVNVLAGPSLTPADVEEIGRIVSSFNLHPVILPDLSGSLDGHVPEDFTPTSLGGTKLSEIRSMGMSEITLAIGESMRPAAETLEKKCGVPFVVFDRLTGLEASDRFLDLLQHLSGEDVPQKYRGQRSRLMDAMLDGHFFFGKKKVAIGAEPDLLFALASFLSEMGSDIEAAVTTTGSTILKKIPAEEVLIGDLEDLEERAVGCDLMITHSHGRQASERLEVPLFRAGIPTFDRLGTAHQLNVGYQGTMRLIFEVGNIFLGSKKENHPDTWSLSNAGRL